MGKMVLERVMNISMATTNDIGNVVEFEEIETGRARYRSRLRACLTW
ncbi:hypothetical protein [Streptomyces sp. NPDC004675]